MRRNTSDGYLLSFLLSLPDYDGESGDAFGFLSSFAHSIFTHIFMAHSLCPPLSLFYFGCPAALISEWYCSQHNASLL